MLDARKKALPRKLTLLPLMAATYFIVAGGPYGLEDIVKDSGYFWTVVFLLVVPFLWSIPTALMVSELSAALPEEGGYYAWVRRALGPFWGVQEAWLSLTASAFDMAIYPTLFVKYLDFFFKACQPSIPAGWPIPAQVSHPLAIAIGMIAVCVVVNILGVRAVGGSSLVLNLVMLLPFVVLVVLALGKPAGPAVAPAAPGFDVIVTGLLFTMWNYMGWDNASTVAGEVDRPQRTYPLAMILTALLVTLTYILPVVAIAHAGLPASAWETGAWVTMGGAIHGPLLATSLAVGGMIGAFGSFNALVMSYSRLPLVLAGEGYLPAIFQRRHPRTGAPWVAILACAVVWSLVLQLELDRMLALDVIVYGLSLLLEFLALIVLRVREPGLPRPFRVPGGMAGAVLIAVGPTVLIGLGIYHERFEQTKPFLINVLLFSGILVALGPLVYLAGVGWRRITRRDTGPR